MNAKEKLKRLCLFLGWKGFTEDDDVLMGEGPFGYARLPILDNNLIEQVQLKLDAQQWNAYINELENIMFNEIDKHARFLTSSNRDIGKCVLIMRSSACQKSQALVNALDLWFTLKKEK